MQDVPGLSESGKGRAIVRPHGSISCYKSSAGRIQENEADHMKPRSIHLAVICAMALLLAAMPVAMHAQDAGPMKPRESTKFPTPPPPTKPEPPTIPPEEIIRRFAAKEDEMVRAILGYTFQKSVRIEEIGPDNKPTGQLEIITQQHITPDGKLYEKPLRRPPATLHHLDIQRGDSDLLAATPLFPLTTAQLPKYEISFGGKQPLDELSAYFFSVKPRALERAHAYFSGVVWVDEQDLVIVKTMGKWVTETGEVTSSVLPFAVFETYRQQIGKNLWFPSYSRSDETVEVGGTKVPIRAIIRWSDFAPSGTAPAADVPNVTAPPPAPAKP
jgi:hypothetical protein